MMSPLAFTQRAWLPWVIGIALLLGLAALARDATLALQPVYKRKTVALHAETGEVFKVVFSARQADPEVIYEIKTQYQGRFDRDLSGLNGQVDDTPYRDFTRHALHRQLTTHGSAGALLAAGAAAWALAARVRSRRRALPA